MQYICDINTFIYSRANILLPFIKVLTINIYLEELSLSPPQMLTSSDDFRRGEISRVHYCL